MQYSNPFSRADDPIHPVDCDYIYWVIGMRDRTKDTVFVCIQKYISLLVKQWESSCFCSGLKSMSMSSRET